MSLLKDVSNIEMRRRVTESRIPVEAMLTLNSIITDGRISNGAQRMVLANLAQALFDGVLNSEQDYHSYVASGQLVETIKNMTDDQVVLLARTVDGVIVSRDDMSKYKKWLKPDHTVIDWMNFVSHKQD